MVFNMIVSATWKVLGNLGPTVAVDFVHGQDLFIFGGSPFDFLDIRI